MALGERSKAGLRTSRQQNQYPRFQKWSNMAAIQAEVNYQPPPPALPSPSPESLPPLGLENSSFTTLPLSLRQGLTVVTFFAFLSFFAGLGLLVYLSWKLISWNLRPLPSERPNQQCSQIPEHRSQTTLNYGGSTLPAEHLCPQMDYNDDADADEKSPKGLRLMWERLRREPPNQFLVLVYNLLLADGQQSLAFLLSARWIGQGSIDSESRICWAQGWFLSTGDLGSSLIITAIAVHTYLGVVKSYRPPTRVFYIVIVSLWLVNYTFALAGVLITWRTGPTLYEQVGVWCGISPRHQEISLYLHFLWTALSILIVAVIYIYIHFYLRRNRIEFTKSHQYPNGPYHQASPEQNASSTATRESENDPARVSTLPIPEHPQNNTDEGTKTKSSSTTTMNSLEPLSSNNPQPNSRYPAFLLYPIIYILCNAPLSISRLTDQISSKMPPGYFCFAGAMLGSAGLLDVLLYATTRRSIVFSGNTPPTQDTGIGTFAFMRTPPGRKFGNVVFVRGGEADEEMGLGGRGRGGAGSSSNSSSDDARVDVSKERRKLPSMGLGGFLQKIQSCAREQRRKRKNNHHLRVSGMDTTRLRIQCETVMSVSVEMDPDRANRSQGSLASEVLPPEMSFAPASRQ